jgi:hypothetical protein
MVVAGRASGSDQFLPLRQDFVHSSQLGRLLRFRFGHYESCTRRARSIIMTNVIDIAKAALTAFNEKDWSKGEDILAANAVHEEKGGHFIRYTFAHFGVTCRGTIRAFSDSICAASSHGGRCAGSVPFFPLAQARTRFYPARASTGTVAGNSN